MHPCRENSQHIHHLRLGVACWAFIFTHLDICDETGSLSPHGYNYVQHRASANICRPNIECLLWFSEGRDDPKVIHLVWVGLLLICTICPHTTLLGFLPASWLGYTVSWGVCTAGNLHITQIIIWCSKRVSFFSFKAALFCLSTHLEFFVLVMILCHFLTHVHLKIEITLLSLDFRKFCHLSTPIVCDQLWQTNLWKPQF